MNGPSATKRAKRLFISALSSRDLEPTTRLDLPTAADFRPDAYVAPADVAAPSPLISVTISADTEPRLRLRRYGAKQLATRRRRLGRRTFRDLGQSPWSRRCGPVVAGTRYTSSAVTATSVAIGSGRVTKLSCVQSLSRFAYVRARRSRRVNCGKCSRSTT